MNDALYIKRIVLREEPRADHYPGSLPVVRNLYGMGGLSLQAPVTFLVGENGIGKSTLIEAIAVAMGFNPEGGSKNFRFSTCNSHSNLYRHLLIEKSFKRIKDGFFLRAESFYNVASNIDELDAQPASAPYVIESYGGVSLHRQSHGESFLALVENRFGGEGIYILDEPEAALSPNRLMRLLVLIHELVKKNSQFIISTHSPILMAYPNAEILELTEDAIRRVSYEQTDHFRLTKQFLDQPQKMLRLLLESDGEET